MRSCLQPDIQGYYVALENLLKTYLGQCFQTNFTTDKAIHVMLPDISPANTAYLTGVAAAFSSYPNGFKVIPTFVPAAQINSEIAFQLDHNLTNSHDAWMLRPYGVGDIFALGGFARFTPATLNGTDLDWADVEPLKRTFGAQWGSAGGSEDTVVLPLEANMQLLYYRADVFTAMNLSVPYTWDDVLSLVALTAGMDFNNDSVADYGFCFERRAGCARQASDLLSVAAPYLQSNGTLQSLFFDLDKLDLANSQSGPITDTGALVNNPAMARALTIYQQLLQTSPSGAGYNVTDICDGTVFSAPTMTDLFGSGRCLMTVGLRDVFQAANSSLTVRGQLGVAQTPGSYSVLDRSSGQLSPCTLALCPWAKYENPALSTQLLNRAPFSARGGWVVGVNARSTPDLQAAATAFLLYLSLPAQAWGNVLGTLALSPFRTQHFTNLSMWSSAGYDPTDTSNFLANSAVGLNHGNVATDLQVRQASQLKAFYSYAAGNLTLLRSVPAVMQDMNASFVRFMTRGLKLSPPLNLSTDLRVQYHILIPAPPLPPPAPAAAAMDGSTSTPSWLPIAIVLPTVGALLLIAASVVYQIRNNRKHKNLFGKVRPPGLGPDTTILVTDIQDSTALWESLAAEVMDRAIKEHHDCMRRLLLKHSGYESATEGDSFIMAFHLPKDALLFAMDGQVSLLTADWPFELLQTQVCKPVWVQGIASALHPKNLQDILDASDNAIPGRGSKIKALAHGLSHDPSRSALPSSSQEHTALSETYTFGTACQRAWKQARREDADKVLIFRGLRVRMGLHAGMHNENEVTYNRTDARTQYGGDTITVAKAVADAAHGGMVLLSEETYKKLPLERLWDKYLVLHVGEHRLRDIPASMNLYHSLNRTLEGRLAHLEPTRPLNTAQAPSLTSAHRASFVKAMRHIDSRAAPRTSRPAQRRCATAGRCVNQRPRSRVSCQPPPGHLRLVSLHTRTLDPAIGSLAQLDPGVLDAPVGSVTVAFQNVVGAQTLLSWNADCAQVALQIFHNLVGEELKKRRGYLVEAVDGLFLAAFQRPADAILWALECNEDMIKQEWPEELLTHELCEELVISASTKEGDVVNTIVFRGLRLKTGVDTGQVLGEVHAMTGRMTYRGKVMNRAARVASTASTGQVLCSSDSWNLATSSPEGESLMAANRVAGSSLGQFRLKGVAEKIEIHHCRKVASQAFPLPGSCLMPPPLSFREHLNLDHSQQQPDIGSEDVHLTAGEEAGGHQPTLLRPPPLAFAPPGRAAAPATPSVA
ncbi:MAG: hypothetical protein WDW36_004384 [Sanguina aurantia]